MDVDIVRCECAIDMVDGTLGTLDLTLSTRDIMGFAPVFFRDIGNKVCFFATKTAGANPIMPRLERVRSKVPNAPSTISIPHS